MIFWSASSAQKPVKPKTIITLLFKAQASFTTLGLVEICLVVIMVTNVINQLHSALIRLNIF